MAEGRYSARSQVYADGTRDHHRTQSTITFQTTPTG